MAYVAWKTDLHILFTGEKIQHQNNFPHKIIGVENS